MKKKLRPFQKKEKERELYQRNKYIKESTRRKIKKLKNVQRERNEEKEERYSKEIKIKREQEGKKKLSGYNLLRHGVAL